MSFSSCRKIDPPSPTASPARNSGAASNYIYIAAVAIALAGCDPQDVREEKALRRQLSHELHQHAYQSAVPLARQLVQRKPQDNNGWKRLVQAQIGLHDFDGAKQSVAEWRKTVQPAPPRTDEFEGDIARAEGDPAGALRAWQKSASNQLKNHRVFGKIGAVEQSQQHWNEAIAAWTASLQLQDNAPARINRAVCLRRLHRWDEAFQDWRRAKQLGPDEPDVHRWSITFENLGKFLEQIRELDAKLEALPGDLGLLCDRALLSLRIGDAELALDDCHIAAQQAPWALRPKLFAGLALIALNRAKECERLSIQQPLRLETMTPEFLETISRLDSAILVEPKNTEHFAARAWQLNEIGQPILALQDAETAGRLEEKNAGAWAEASYALTKLGRGSEAFGAIKHATELDPNLAAAWQYRGELEMQRGDNLAAIDSLSRALAIEQTVGALEKREECYRRAGLQARADEDQRALRQLTARAVNVNER
jgi:tetratricopeptide (TPR) repeat protein